MLLIGFFMHAAQFILGLGEVDFDYVHKMLELVKQKIDGSALLMIYYGLYEEAKGRPIQVRINLLTIYIDS